MTIGPITNFLKTKTAQPIFLPLHLIKIIRRVMLIGPTTNFLRTKSAQSMFFRLTSNKNQRSKILTFHICVEILAKLVRDLPKNY